MTYQQTTYSDVCAVRHGGNVNSEIANFKAGETKSRDREAIRSLIEQSVDGLTLKEACKIMGRLPNQISGRFTELKADGLTFTNGRRNGCGVHYIQETES